MGGEIGNRNKIEWKILLVWHDIHVTKIFQEQFNLDTQGSVEEKTGIIVEISPSVTQKRKSAYQGKK